MSSRCYIVVLLFLVASSSLWGQSSATYQMSASTTGTTYQVPTEGVQIRSDGVGGTYSKGCDFVITVNNNGNPCVYPYYLALTFSQFNINAADTLFIYDGPSTSSPLLLMANNSLNPLSGERNIVFASLSNNSHALTLRFKTANHSGPETGFFCSVECREVCEISSPHINDTYERLRNGIPYASDNIRMIDGRRTITVCAGDGVRLHGHADYTSFTGHYTPTDATSVFTWTLDEDAEVSTGLGLVAKDYAVFDTLDCHEAMLTMSDVNGCAATTFDEVRILVATNPIRTISNLGTVCSGSELPVLVSYEENAILHLDTAVVTNIRTRTNYVKTFIPDGPNCATRCYQAPVTFNEFPQGRTVMSKDDICSICINFEHSYMGDYDLNIICPSGRKATLKYYCQSNCPAGHGGGGTYTGYPYGGSNHDRWDGASGRFCDSAYNMYGVGLDYCFSRNGDYTLVDGRPANTTYNGSHYISSSGYTVSVTHTFDPRPTAFRNSGTSDAGARTFSTKKPSNYANKSDYYKPADDFSSLVGCPLNGTWKIELCDKWKQDNGWVFGWSMDICSVQEDDDCIYGVGIDSVTWDIFPERGTVNPVTVRQDAANPMQYYMSAGDTSGHYYARINVTDRFGCHWDSTGHFTILQRPTVSLGNDIFSCTTAQPTFDATVSLTDNVGGSISYLWSTGQTSPVITPSVTGTSTYSVSVTNSPINGDTARCIARDTVRVVLGIVPQARFALQNAAAVYCEPFEAQFQNLSTNTSVYQWDFGDGTTSNDVNPSHIFMAGTYAIHLNAATGDGCSDDADVMYITVGSSSSATVHDTIVENSLPYSFASLSFNANQSDTLIVRQNRTGCDSLITFSLHVYPNVDTTLDSSICETFLPITWNGVTFSDDLSTSVQYFNRYGADSTVYMTLHVLRQSQSTTRDTIVENSLPYLFADLTFTDTQNDTIIVRTNSVGCDSNIHFSLWVHHNVTTYVDSVLCENSLPIVWNTVAFFTDGNGQHTLRNQYGADSVVMMTLHVLRNTRYTRRDSVVENSLPYHFADLTFSTDQSDTTIMRTNSVGCDSIIRFSLFVHRNVAVQVDSTVCDYALPLEWNGLSFVSDSTASVTLTNRWGADSVVVMRVVVLHSTSEPPTHAEACVSYVWDVTHIIYNRSDTYRDTSLNSVGCDSVQTLVLRIYPPTNIAVFRDTTIHTCGHATLLATGGDAFLWQPSASVSDSLIFDTVAVVIASPEASQIYTVTTYRLGSEVVANGDFRLGNTGFFSDMLYVDAIDANGEYTVAYDVASATNLDYMMGRDHTTPTNTQGRFLFVHNPHSSELIWGQTMEVMPHTRYLFSLWATALAEPDIAPLQFFANGRSIGTMTPLDSVSPNGVWQRYSTVWNSGESTHVALSIHTTHDELTNHIYGIDDISMRPILCSDSRQVSVAVVVPVETDTTCDIYTWHNAQDRQLDRSGLYYDTMVTQEHCDSTIALNLIVDYSASTYLDTSECDSYRWPLSGRTYTSTTADSVRLATVHNCDSNVVMHVEIRYSSPVDVQYDTICDLYVWHYDSTSYTADTTVVRHALNIEQCDSTTILHLKVHHRSAIFERDTACDDFTWPYNGQHYTASSKENHTAPDQYGCDSSVTLLLTVYYSDTVSLTDTTCDNQPYAFGIRSLLVSGIYHDTLLTRHGCDSLVTLDLTVLPTYDIHIYDTIKEDDLPYQAPDGGTFIHSAVDERMLFHTAVGQCDSLIHLNLHVIYKLLDCDELLIFPNLVTPNGDGVNDLFSVVGIDNGCWLHNELSIYNRWGVLVHRVFDIQSPSDGWDPGHAPAGTYYYRFQASNAYHTIDRKGVVEVVK